MEKHQVPREAIDLMPPFTPTAVNDTPATCYACGRHAHGLGIGNRREPKYLCEECLDILEHVKSVRRWTPYEYSALNGGIDAVAEFIDSIGGKTELSEFTEAERQGLVQAAWGGCANRLREVVKSGEVPF